MYAPIFSLYIYTYICPYILSIYIPVVYISECPVFITVEVRKARLSGLKEDNVLHTWAPQKKEEKGLKVRGFMT